MTTPITAMRIDPIDPANTGLVFIQTNDTECLIDAQEACEDAWGADFDTGLWQDHSHGTHQRWVWFADGADYEDGTTMEDVWFVIEWEA